MPRVIEFDENYVLEQAMHTFWKQGYNQTSMDDLMKNMDLGRQSIYNTFGSKHELFIKSMDHYIEQLNKQLNKHLLSPESNLQDLKNHLLFSVDSYIEEPGYYSCLLVNSALEFGKSDRTILSKILQGNKLSLKGINNTLENALKKGELTENTDSKLLSETIFTYIQGISILSKSGMRKKEFVKQIELLFDMMTK